MASPTAVGRDTREERVAMRIVSTSLLRLVRAGPALVVSLVIELLAFSLLPDPIAGPAMVGFAILVGALALGFLESSTVRLVTWSRPAPSAELEIWAPVQAHLAGHGVDERRLLIRRSSRHTTRGVVRLGRESLVITPGLLDALDHRRLAVSEVAAVVAHTEGWHRAMTLRGELAMLVVTVPWRVLAGVFGAMTGGMSRLPLGGIAWGFRGVIGVICVVQAAAEGRPWSGVLGGSVIALSYLVPAAGRELSGRAMVRADDLVVSLGLGVVLAALWRRLGEPVATLQLQRLETPTPAAVEAPERPRLYLVPS